MDGTDRSKLISNDHELIGNDNQVKEEIETTRGSSRYTGSTVKALPTRFTDEDVELGIRRGTHIAEILSGFGRHWIDSGATEGWTASSVCEYISEFLSHSWRASGKTKTLALCIYYNLKAALVGSMCVALLTALLAFIGVLPTIPAGSAMAFADGTNVHMDFSAFGIIFGSLSFLLLLGFWQRIRAVIEMTSLLAPRYAFLDKLSIHQTDATLKQRGIESLGSFLSVSKKFVVLWSPEYFTRLWCVYEVSVRAYLGQGNIELCPLPVAMYHSTLFLCFLIFLFTSQVFIVCIPGLNPYYYFPLGTILSIGLFVKAVLAIIQYFKDCAYIEEQFTSFDIYQTQCFAESDRDLVYNSVTAFFDPDGLDREKALTTFNEYVRRDLWAVMKAAIGNPGQISYVHAFTITMPIFWCDTIAFAVTFRQLSTFQIVSGWVFPDLVCAPLAMALMIKAISACERLPTCSAWGRLPGGDSAENTAVVQPANNCCLCLFTFGEILLAMIVFAVVYNLGVSASSFLTHGPLLALDLVYVALAAHMFDVFKGLTCVGNREVSESRL